MNKVADVLKAQLPTGGWVLSLSDIHLHANRTEASAWVETELSERIAQHMSGPGVIVLNGDIIELWAGHKPDVVGALKAHSKLIKAIREYAGGADHQVVFIVGNHDGQVGWDTTDQHTIEQQLGATLCFRFELSCNDRVVMFEHGNQLDPDNSFEDPRDPHDHPLGQYIVQKVLPLAHKSQSDVLADLDTLAEPQRFPVFVFSRILYRVIGQNIGWLLLPFGLALFYRLLIVLGFYFAKHSAPQQVLDFLVIVDIVVILDALLLMAVGFVALRHFWHLSESLVDRRGNGDHNRPTRELTTQLIEQKKVVGAVFGHTHQPEVSRLGVGFYANSGSGTKMTRSYPARFGLPRVYIPTLQLSWLELECGQRLAISLYDGNRRTAGGKPLERLLLKKPIVYTQVKQVKQLEV